MGAYAGPPRLRPFCRYVLARDRAHTVEESYRVYVAESLRLAPQGKCLGTPWADLLKRSLSPADPRSGEEIAADVLSGIGLEVV